MPLFADVLKVVAGRVPLIVEYKFDDNSKWGSRDVELMEKGDALLQAYSGAYVIESFNPAAVNWYKENRPEVCRGQLSWWPQGEEKPSDPGLARQGICAGALIFDWISRPDFRRLRLAWRQQSAGTVGSFHGCRSRVVDGAQPRRARTVR